MNTTTTRRKTRPSLELLIWLLCIWAPVVYVYFNGGQPQVNTFSNSSIRKASPSQKTSPQSSPPIHTVESELQIDRKGGKDRTAQASQSKPKTKAGTVSVRNGISEAKSNIDSRDLEEGSKEDATNEPEADTLTHESATTETQQENDEGVSESAGDQLQIIASLPRLPYSPPKSPYLTMAQRRISREWYAPTTNRPLETIVRFRIEKSGNLSHVEIERSSGNEYFDLAAKRAVMSSDPLPPFYPELDDEYLNTHLRFTSESLEAHR